MYRIRNFHPMTSNSFQFAFWILFNCVYSLSKPGWKNFIGWKLRILYLLKWSIYLFGKISTVIEYGQEIHFWELRGAKVGVPELMGKCILLCIFHSNIGSKTTHVLINNPLSRLLMKKMRKRSRCSCRENRHRDGRSQTSSWKKFRIKKQKLKVKGRSKVKCHQWMKDL